MIISDSLHPNSSDRRSHNSQNSKACCPPEQGLGGHSGTIARDCISALSSPILLIATSLILAIRTAKWPTQTADHFASRELDAEIAFAAETAERVLVHLVQSHEAMFPQRKEPWYKPSEEDVRE